MRKNENIVQTVLPVRTWYVCAKVSFVLLNLIARFGWFLGITHACMCWHMYYIPGMYVCGVGFEQCNTAVETRRRRKYWKKQWIVDHTIINLEWSLLWAYALHHVVLVQFNYSFFVCIYVVEEYPGEYPSSNGYSDNSENETRARRG